MRRAPIRSAHRHPTVAGVVALLATAVTALAAGCVPVSRYHEPHAMIGGTTAPGVDETADALAGNWTGHYDAPFYARRGAFDLSLQRVAHVVAGRLTTTVSGAATFAGPSAPARVVVDSARVGRGRVVLFFAPFADQESGATLQLRLDGAVAADTLGGRLRADAAATFAPEHHGGWRLIRVARSATVSRTP